LTQASTFQQLVENTRRKLARHYLNQTSVELNEVAFLLGFEDANSFFRVFQSWEGTSPTEWRTRASKVRGNEKDCSLTVRQEQME